MKKKYLPEKKTSIWVDQEDAYIIRLEEDKESAVQHITSGVESRVRIRGEKKVFARFGNTFIDDQEKKQRRQQHERKRYFDEIIELVGNDNYIFIYGPGKGKEELKNAFEKAHGINAKVIAMETTNQLTKNQRMAKTVEYFTSSEFREAKKKLLHPPTLLH